MLESNNHTDIDDEIKKLVNLFGSSLKDHEQLQQFLQHEKNPKSLSYAGLTPGQLN